ncbi:hypothetical protein [Microbacterium testaceum]|uniref:hypothetical protein n=1 Tax=Microbacterium testaceum TaxID=2033 RepID=UPI001056E32B|nr:hypothetical protein [Microbacterium testaceum]
MRASDEEVGASDPARRLDDRLLARVVDEAWHRASSTAPNGPRFAERRFLVPVAFAAVAVTTGAALAVPVWLGMGGVRVDPDVVIPIRYTTSTGVNVSCSWAVHIGEEERSPTEERVAEALRETSWDGVGQDIYDQAIENPRAPQPGETWAVDTQETRDAISFKLAILPVVERRLPTELQGAASQWGSTDTCTGPFR